MMLTRYEATRIVGLRALHLSGGSSPNVNVKDETLRCDMLYVAALELSLGKLDAIVQRGDGSIVKATDVKLPPNVNMFLDARDGGTRSLR